MNKETALLLLSNAPSYFAEQNLNYQSWGKVEVLEIAILLDSGEVLMASTRSSELHSDWLSATELRTTYQKIFSQRKSINVILLTKQQHASQIEGEIPAILDDQAQLLGVSVRIAKAENEIEKALKRRFAAIIPEKKCICIGTNLEESYIAAQLLEKTAKVFLEAEYLGGAKRIPKIEAWLMQQYYLFKYKKVAKS